jgi:uncharacterized protein involved in outer membrane biogenesis
MEHTKRILKRVLIGIVAVLVLFFGSVFVILRFYEDDVVRLVLDKLNERLVTKANVEAVDLTYWETFPNASLKFTNVYIQETFPEKDTLLSADELYLEFSLLNLFRGNYTLEEITGSGMHAHLKLNAKGEDNWHFLKPTEGADSKLNLNLEEVKLSSTRFVYEDRKSLFFVDYNIENAKLSGAFSDERFRMDADIAGEMRDLISGDDSFLANREVLIDMGLDVDLVGESYAFEDGKVSIDAIPFLVNGRLKTGATPFVDMNFRGNELTMKDVLNVLPSGYKDKIAEYDADGVVTFDAQVKGSTKGKSQPDVNAKFRINSGALVHKGSGVKMSGIAMSGKYVKGTKQDRLDVEEFSANLEAGSIAGKGSIMNMSNPVGDFQLRADISLQALQQFLALDTLQICEGRLVAEAQFKGPLGSGMFDKIESSGKAQLSEGRLQLKGSNRLFTDLASTVLFNDVNASVQRFVGKVNDSDFEVNGTLNNLIPFLLKENEILDVQANLNSNQIDFSKLVETSEGSAAQKEYEFNLPSYLRFRLNSKVKKFTFERFEATNVSGVVVYDGNKLDIDPVSFATAEGTFLSQMRLTKASRGGYDLVCSANFKDINIQKLFYSFNNFGQSFITEKHLKGKAKATVQMEVPLSAALKMDKERLHMLMDIGIANGQLTGLESLQEVAKYIKSNKLIAPFVDEDAFAEKMKDIRFSNLENVIEIKNQKIIIPTMAVKSSVLDISASGVHGFDNSIDYTIGFRLRDVLVRKSASNEMDDGLGKQLFIYMKGTTENPKFGMDKDAAREDRQEEIAREKESVKALLKQELGLFKNDANVGTYQEQPQKKETTTTIEWEEFDGEKKDAPSQEDTPKTKLKDASDTKSKDGKKVPKWLQEKD